MSSRGNLSLLRNTAQSLRQAADSSRGALETRRGWFQPSVLVSAFVLAVIALILIPLPPNLLDIFLVCNIVVALILLLRALSIAEPVRLFSFPTMLLMATLLRLALNVSSTRLILLHGDQGFGAAGQVIRAFGNFVVAGNFYVGAILFVLIAVVNFVVIAKGSARVAEVAARFVLDALPGKQLAIDADVRAGLLSREEAVVKRSQLTQESQFYGAMDGAMKFVQGDAVAGLVIAFINAIGGVGMGLSRGMEFSAAVNTFGVLTIGDGLVNIIPSLLMSLCAGVIVTNVSGASGRGVGGEVFNQFVADPRALTMGSIALLLLSIVPGFPFFPFFLVGGLLLATIIFFYGKETVLAPSWDAEVLFTDHNERHRITESRNRQLLLGGGVKGELAWAASDLEQAEVSTKITPTPVSAVMLEVDPGLSASTGQAEFSRWKEDFLTHFATSCHKLYLQKGLIIPQVNCRMNPSLKPGSYRIFIREQLIRSGVIVPSSVFAVTNVSTISLLGLKPITVCNHPVDSRAALWLSERSVGIAALNHLGIEILSPGEFLGLEIIGSVFQAVDEVLGVNEVKSLITTLKSEHQFLLDEVFEKSVISYAEFTELLRRLLRERVSIRDIKLILDGVAEFASSNPDDGDRVEWLNELHSFVRLILSRTILGDALSPGGKLRVFILSNDIEEEFRTAVSHWEHSRQKPPLDPHFEAKLRENTKRIFSPVLDRGVVPAVILCAADIRAAVQDFFGRQMQTADWVRTLSFSELEGIYEPESVGVISVAL